MTTPRPHAELNKHKGNQVPLMSAAEVNALPPKAREYIYQLESNADPAGMVRENMQLRDTNKGLQVMYRNRTDELDRVQQDLEKANISTEHFEREWYLRGDELDTLRAQLAEAQRRIKELETPTMFWDFNNPEHGAFDSPYYAICDGDFDEGAEVSLITARSLPTKTVRVTRDSEGNYDYEYIDAAMGEPS